MGIFRKHPGGKGETVTEKLQAELVCMHKLTATREENALDSARGEYLTASAEIRKRYRQKVGYDCPMCNGKKMFCPEYIGVVPDYYEKHDFK